MSAFGRTRAWLRALLRRGALEREMHEEMAAHIAQATERFLARGMSPTEARRAAQREFGNIGVVQEHGRDARGGQWLDHLVADLKYAFRYFARMPLSTITIVLTLALGIGFSSAVFSALHGIFSRPAPGVPDDRALVKIRGISNAPPFDRQVSFPELAAYASLTGTFASVAGWVNSGVVVDLGDATHGTLSARAQFVTPNFFRLVGVRLAAGRGFAQSRFEERDPPELSAIISDAFASELFGDAKLAIGQQVKVNDVMVAIVGLTPPRFNGAVQSGESRTIWLPLSAMASVERASPMVFADPNGRWFEAVARLQPGVSVADALPAVRVIAARIDADAKAQLKRTATATADVVRLRGMIDPTRYANERGPGAVMASVLALLILLVCTTTVNSLLVGAAVARRYEIGVRLALGASRARVIRQLLTEIGILAIAGGALGMWVFGILSRVTEIAQDGFDISPNWATIGFTLTYALLTATLAGLSPALHATRAGLADVLKDSASGARKSRLQRTFVVAQIAIAQPLMVTLAAVMANTITQIPSLENVRLRERLAIAEFDTRMRYTISAPDKLPDLTRRLGELPGVTAILPVGYGGNWVTLEAASSAPVDPSTPLSAATGAFFEIPPGYLATVGAPIVRGRDFVASDTLQTVTPVVVSRLIASQLFNSSDPIGQRLRRRSPGDSVTEVEIVGVVDMDQETNTLAYPPDAPPIFALSRPRGESRFLIRTSQPADVMLPAIMSAAREEARMFPLTMIGTLANADRERRASRIQIFGVGAGCGMIALLLASVGLYAMLSIAVEQRRREIGIRVALGAHASQVVRMFFTSGLRVTLIGVALGMPFSLAGLAIPLHSSGLSWDYLPRSAAMVTLAVVVVASLASWLPARRAAHVDPMLALRSE